MRPAFQLYRGILVAPMARCIATKCNSDLPASWDGLHTWRSSGIDKRRHWGEKDAMATEPTHRAPIPVPSLAEGAVKVLETADPFEKAAVAHEVWSAQPKSIGLGSPPQRPARPARPLLVSPKQIPQPKQSGLPLNVYMLHNLAHIELNAIDLAFDTVARFSHLGPSGEGILPKAFFEDFARVGDDESRHLSWCLQRLGELGYEYGHMPAHDLLWEGAESSTGDIKARLAIVPMSQEARGLDSGERLAERLIGYGDNRSAAIVHRIALEERAHVAVGVTWFSVVCQALGLDVGAEYKHLMALYAPGLLKAPFNHARRQEVGLLREWYDQHNQVENLHQRLEHIVVSEVTRV